MRQWDVIGEWVPFEDPRKSAVLAYGRKWIGLTWSQIDDDMILRVTPGKTERTSGAAIVVDLKLCPMVLEELATFSGTRVGPIVINERTALPYRYEAHLAAWRRDRSAAGIAPEVWNRDIRAGGITEARSAGAAIADVAKTAGHTRERTTADVYDRAALEAHRRVAAARAQRRKNDGNTNGP